jgi:hypothetical protein
VHRAPLLGYVSQERFDQLDLSHSAPIAARRADPLRLAQLAPSWFQNEHSSKNTPYDYPA